MYLLKIQVVKIHNSYILWCNSPVYVYKIKKYYYEGELLNFDEKKCLSKNCFTNS